MGGRREGETLFYHCRYIWLLAVGCQLLAAVPCTVLIHVWGGGLWGRWMNYCVPALVRPPFSALPLIGHILAHHSRLCRHHHGGFHPTILAPLHPLFLT